MKAAILITARMSSSRLPGKHLIPVAGKPLLSYLVGRIQTGFADEIAAGSANIAVATSREAGNEEFEKVMRGACRVCYGEPHNIPRRHLQAAKELGVDAVVSVDGDDILSSVGAMRAVYEALKSGADYARTEGLPLGLNVSGYTARFLEASLAKVTEKVIEVGWDRIFDPKRLRKIPFTSQPGQDKLRLTLDYPDDLNFFRSVIEGLGERVVAISDEALVAEILRYEWWRINSAVSEEYWRNYNAQKALEAQK